MPKIEQVSAYLRTLKAGSFWYASWHEGGERIIRPTGLEHNLRQKDGGRKAAIEIGRTLRDERAAKKAAPAPTFREYAGSFYALDGSYLKRQCDKGKPLNSQWAASLQGMLDKHVLPKWGSTRLDAFNSVDVENWLADLPLSNQTRADTPVRVPTGAATRGGQGARYRRQPSPRGRGPGQGNPQARHSEHG